MARGASRASSASATLTDKQRREEKAKARKLTSEYRSHLDELDENLDAFRNPLSDKLQEHFIKSDQQSQKGFTVEHAVLDATIFQKLSQYSKEQAAKLQTGIKDFNVGSFVDRLCVSMQSDDDDEGPTVLDLALLGRQIEKYFKSTPVIDFMLGKADSSDKKKTRRKTIDKSSQRQKQRRVVRPQQIKEEATGKTETDKEIERMYAALKRAGPTVEFYPFLVDPNNFNRSVENIFHVSFLIKEGRVEVDMQKERPTMTIRKPKNDTEDIIDQDDEHDSQMIMRFDNNTWAQIKEQYNITECILPPRR